MAKLQPARVGFKLGLLVRKYESECLLGCDSYDAYLWSKQTVKWLTAQRKRATTKEQIRLTTRQIKTFHQVMERSTGCISTCESAVGAFVSSCRLSKLATESWGKPVLVDEVPYVWPTDRPKGIELNDDDAAWLKANPRYVGLMASLWDVAKTQVQKIGDDVEQAIWGKIVPWALGGFAVFLGGTYLVTRAKQPRRALR